MCTVHGALTFDQLWRPPLGLVVLPLIAMHHHAILTGQNKPTRTAVWHNEQVGEHGGAMPFSLVTGQNEPTQTVYGQ